MAVGVRRLYVPAFRGELIVRLPAMTIRRPRRQAGVFLLRFFVRAWRSMTGPDVTLITVTERPM